MSVTVKEQVISELDSLIQRAERLSKSFRRKDTILSESNIPEHEHRAFVAAALATIERIAGEDSQYYKQAPTPEPDDRLTLEDRQPRIIPGLRGVLVSLRDAVEGGLLESIESRLRASIHDDMLAQSAELLNSGYHVAAMVLIGGVLENHLQQLCNNLNLTWSGRGSISKYNDLLKEKVYKKTIWRRIQAVGDVRNDAAHGDVEKAAQADVEDSLEFVQRVISDYPE